METYRSSFKPSSSTFLSVSTIVIGGQVLSASRLFLGLPLHWSSHTVPSSLQLIPTPFVTYISQSPLSSSLSQVHKPPSLQRDPRACAVGSGSTHAEHPLTNQLPPAPKAPFLLAAGCPAPTPCLCSFLALMLGNQCGMPRPLPFRLI